MCDKNPLIWARLLAWYDGAARDLPWRVSPARRKAGERPDPYRVWLSEIMLQQTTVAAVVPYFYAFTRRWPDIFVLADADEAEVMAAWAGLGYYARARNLLKCARALAAHHDGVFPKTRAGLQSLPGIGPYTSAAIAAIAYDAPETVVDGNVERVMARYHAVTTPLPEAKAALRALAQRHTPEMRAGDYAQAVMDLGATVCTPRGVNCAGCPLCRDCAARARGIAPDLPYRRRSAAKPHRRGAVFVARREDGALLLERRPGTGMLGGMVGWPGSTWDKDEDGADLTDSCAPLEADWRELPDEVRHSFTHFHLSLRVRVGKVATDVVPRVGKFVPEQEFCREDLPTLMRKVYDLAKNAFDPV